MRSEGLLERAMWYCPDMSVLADMSALLNENTDGKQYKVREPDKITLPDLKLKPGDVFKITGRGGSLRTATRVSDGAQSSISSKFLDRMIAHMQIIEIK
jgi:ribosomal protein L21